MKKLFLIVMLIVSTFNVAKSQDSIICKNIICEYEHSYLTLTSGLIDTNTITLTFSFTSTDSYIQFAHSGFFDNDSVFINDNNLSVEISEGSLLRITSKTVPYTLDKFKVFYNYPIAGYNELQFDTDSKLLYIYDILGKNYDIDTFIPKFNQIYIYVYDNGYAMKKMITQ